LIVDHFDFRLENFRKIIFLRIFGPKIRKNTVFCTRNLRKVHFLPSIQGRRTLFGANLVEIKKIENRVHGRYFGESAPPANFFDVSSPVFFSRTALKSAVKTDIFK